MPEREIYPRPEKEKPGRGSLQEIEKRIKRGQIKGEEFWPEEKVEEMRDEVFGKPRKGKFRRIEELPKDAREHPKVGQDRTIENILLQEYGYNPEEMSEEEREEALWEIEQQEKGEK